MRRSGKGQRRGSGVREVWKRNLFQEKPQKKTKKNKEVRNFRKINQEEILCYSHLRLIISTY